MGRRIDFIIESFPPKIGPRTSRRVRRRGDCSGVCSRSYSIGAPAAKSVCAITPFSTPCTTYDSKTLFRPSLTWLLTHTEALAAKTVSGISYPCRLPRARRHTKSTLTVARMLTSARGGTTKESTDRRESSLRQLSSQGRKMTSSFTDSWKPRTWRTSYNFRFRFCVGG